MVTPKDQGYNFISGPSYLQQDFVPNVATFNISPKNYGIMSQYQIGRASCRERV